MSNDRINVMVSKTGIAYSGPADRMEESLGIINNEHALSLLGLLFFITSTATIIALLYDIIRKESKKEN